MARVNERVGAGLLEGGPKPEESTVSQLARLADERTVLLTTFRRDGTPVATPVHVAGRGARIFFRTFDPSGKLKRIRRNPAVLVAPCTARGKVTGPATKLRARVLDGAEAEQAARLLTEKYPLVHGLLVPAFHRLRRFTTVHLELIED